MHDLFARSRSCRASQDGCASTPTRCTLTPKDHHLPLGTRLRPVVRKSHMSHGAGPEFQQRPDTVRSRGRIVSFLTSAGGLLTAVATILTAVVAIIGLLVQHQSDPPTVDAQPSTSATVSAPQATRKLSLKCQRPRLPRCVPGSRASPTQAVRPGVLHPPLHRRRCGTA